MGTESAKGITAPDEENHTWHNMLFVCIFILGASLRAIDTRRAIDQADWRECDVAAIARNYQREGMDLFYPRIDWRGDGPGYAEMEFPLYPWTIAVISGFVGHHELVGRVIAYCFSIFALIAFLLLARSLLPPWSALLAGLFFAMSPLLIKMATGLHPESMMFAFYLISILTFLRWMKEGRRTDYWAALIFTALAILAKSPAALLGIFFALLVISQHGLGVFRQGSLWLFAALALLPGILWYSHAHHLWLTYGNSLGVSNEWHWAGWDLFTNPKFVMGILSQEIHNVWMRAGCVVGAFALFSARWNQSTRVIVYWLTAVFIFYLVTCRTTGDDWAFYYHIVSVPPVALVFGLGTDYLRTVRFRRPAYYMIISCFFLGMVFLVVLGTLVATGSHARNSLLGAGVLGLAAVMMAALDRTGCLDFRPGTGNWMKETRASFVWCTLLVATMAVLLEEARLVHFWYKSLVPDPFYLKAAQIRPFLSKQGLIVASGGKERDEDGYPVAFNTPYLFYWLDRKGFNASWQGQSVEELRSFAARGARYFVADRAVLAAKPGFEDKVRSTFPVVVDVGAFIVFDLDNADESRVAK